MRARSHLKLRDVQRIHRLMEECCEQWADPAAWRGHLLRGVIDLVGAESASWVELATRTDGTLIGLTRAEALLSGNELRIFHEAVAAGSAGEVEVLSHPPMLREFSRRGRSVGPRQRFVDDVDWYRSAWWHDYRKTAGMDQQVLSLRLLESGNIGIITVDRSIGGAAFDSRAARCLNLVSAEVLRLQGAPLATEAHRSLHRLSPRLRETLQCLLEGDSERQAALRLGISQTTVHQYVGHLHRHFAVSSRGELLAYFIRRRPVLA